MEKTKQNLKSKALTMLIFLLIVVQSNFAQEGVFNVTGDVTLASTQNYEVQLKDMTGSANGGHDLINVSGDLSLNGTLTIVLDGYTPSAGDEFAIMNFGGSLTGTFAGGITWAGTMLADGWEIDYGVHVPGRVSIYAENSVLPIKLLNFTVSKQKDNLYLTWQTASEKNSDYFDIEHSTNGKDFFKIESIRAKGNSNVTQHYSFIHQNPNKGLNYYRLKQIDLDGTFVYSKTVSAVFESQEITFYPNPTTGVLYFSESVQDIVIYDMIGKEILRINTPSEYVDLSYLVNGSYIVEINNGRVHQTIIIDK